MIKWIRKVKQVFSKAPSITLENIPDNIHINITIGDPVKNKGAGTVTIATHGGGGWGGSTLSMKNGGVSGGSSGGTPAGGGSCEVPPQNMSIEEHK